MLVLQVFAGFIVCLLIVIIVILASIEDRL